jgi:hypothetical protein
MRDDYNANIGKVDGMSLEDVENKLDTTVFLGNSNNLPNGYSMDAIGNMYNAKGEGVLGVTNSLKSTIFGKPYSQITIAPSLNGFDVTFRNMVFKHEFMHAWHWQSGFSNFDLYSERATSTFSKAYLNAYGYNSYSGTYSPAIGNYPSQYGWRNFNKTIPLWIK